MAINYLLDTHALLWYFEGNPNLSQKASDIIQTPQWELGISLLSLWEVAIKLNVGKINLQVPFKDFLNYVRKANILILSPGFSDLIRYQNLPLHHRDPFDRMIIVQSQGLSAPVISKDTSFDHYDVERVW